MHATINAKHQLNKRVLAFENYIDTIALSFAVPKLMTIDRKRILKCYGSMPRGYSKPELLCCGYTFHCPQPELLLLCAELTEKYCGSIVRLDISADARPSNQLSVDEQLAFFKEHCLLIRRGKGIIMEHLNVDGTVGYNYVPHAHETGAPRDLCIYHGEPSKLHPDGPKVFHLDVRLRQRALQGINIENVQFLDPSELILKHLRFVEFDRQKAERRLFKQIAQGKTSEEGRRLIDNAKRYRQLDFVQRWHDQYPGIRLRPNNDLVSFQNELKWGAVRRANSKKPEGHRK